MAATDVPPDRLAEAKAKVLEALRDLPANGTVSVIAAGRTARVVVNGTTDLGRVRAAIEGITVSPSTGDLGDALNLADALAARAGDAEILVATDAALAIQPTNRLDHKVSVLQVGRERENQAIVALAVRPALVGRDAVGLRERRQPRHRARPAAPRAVRRRRPHRGQATSAAASRRRGPR